MAKGLSPEAIHNLFQRAKVTVDLGMPGPERLSTEAALFSALPMVSKRWNGASHIDFPTLYKSDPMDNENRLSISNYILELLYNYEEHINNDREHLEEFLNGLSMWRRLARTADLVFSSSTFHFIIFANNLIEEQIAIFQCLALYYLYPFARIDVYVHDRKWFLRHFYIYWDLMRRNGYSRCDSFHPNEYESCQRDRHWNMFNVKRIGELDLDRIKSDAILTEMDDKDDGDIYNKLATLELRPPWNVVAMILPLGITPSHPQSIYEVLQHRIDKTKSDKINNSVNTVYINANQNIKPIVVIDYNATLAEIYTSIKSYKKSATKHDNINDATNYTAAVNGFINICRLLDTGTGNELVFGVRTTAMWNIMRNFAYETNFKCKL
jgi:hypothetical protein